MRIVHCVGPCMSWGPCFRCWISSNRARQSPLCSCATRQHACAAALFCPRLRAALVQDLCADCASAKALFDKAAEILGYDLLEVCSEGELLCTLTGHTALEQSYGKLHSKSCLYFRRCSKYEYCVYSNLPVFMMFCLRHNPLCSRHLLRHLLQAASPT